ncbi:RHS domain-containing protein [Pseudomonas sp. TE50-2]|uniref:RHS domain-containing protein n=1 Tax=Pseudomonas sp. TE50-2 TaxID=3142707 RepID=UPI003466C5F0
MVSGIPVAALRPEQRPLECTNEQGQLRWSGDYAPFGEVTNRVINSKVSCLRNYRSKTLRMLFAMS